MAGYDHATYNYDNHYTIMK